MPLERIGEWGTTPQASICMDREHNPPSMIVLEPGAYKYTCPSCGKVQYFHVARKSWL